MSEDKKPTRLPLNETPHGVVNHLIETLPEIKAVYCVLELKNGEYYEALSGDLSGLSFAINILQVHLFRAMNK